MEVYSRELLSLVKHTPEGCYNLCKVHHGYFPCPIEMADCDDSVINSAKTSPKESTKKQP